MNKLLLTARDFLKRNHKEFEEGQYIYDSESGRVGVVERFSEEKRRMKVRHRHNVTCEYSGKEINRFRPYFGMLAPEDEGGYEDNYIDTIYGTESQCDKLVFMDEQEGKVELDYDSCKEVADRYGIGVEKVDKEDAGFVNGHEVAAPVIDCDMVELGHMRTYIEEDRGTITYLAHPLTTHGTMEENYADERRIARQLHEKGYNNLVRPLTIVPSDFTAQEAANIWMPLLALCDRIILSGAWEKSDGCLMELACATELGIDVFRTVETGSDMSVVPMMEDE